MALLPVGTTYVTTETEYRIRSPHDDPEKSTPSRANVAKDRAFRSVKHMHDTLAAWQMVDVAFASAREGFDTSTAIGRLLMNLLASLAEFELEVLSERVRAGMERARREGKTIGRPKVVDREEVRQMLPEVQARIEAGEISRNQAAKMLGIGKATLLRLLDGPKTGSG